MTEIELQELAKGIVHTVWRCGAKKFKSVKEHQSYKDSCLGFVLDKLKEVQGEKEK